MEVIEKSWVSEMLDLPTESLSFDSISKTPFGKVVKVLSPSQTLFFKTDEVLGCEIKKTIHIANRLGASTIDIAGASSGNNWLLSRCAGSEVFNARQKKHWFQAMSSLARLHLLKLTAQDFQTLPVSTFSVDDFRDFVLSKSAMEYWDISELDQQKLIEISDHIAQSFKNSPFDVSTLSICHGDSHARNVLVDSDEDVRWFDWREAHIGNPVCDLGFFLWWLTPDRKQLGIQIETTNDFIERLSLEYQLAAYGEARFGSAKELMSIGLAQRAMLYHGTYFELLDNKPFYVTYALRQLIKLHSQTA